MPMQRKSGAAHKSTPARQAALGGVLSAVAIVILLGGGLLSVGTFAAPLFAGLCLVPIAMDMGAKWALLCYASVSILSFLLVPDQELVLLFIFFAGYYPILYPTLQKIKNRAVRLVVKLFVCNAAVAAVYSVLYFLLLSPALRQEASLYGIWHWGGLLALGNVTFLLYDTMLGKARFLYEVRFRRYLFH